MVILGISFTHDGTISVVRDGMHVFSIAEERLTRRKGNIGFPFEGLRYIIREKIITSEEITAVAIAADVFKKEWARSFALMLVEDKKYYDFQNDKAPADFFLNDASWEKISSDAECREYAAQKISQILIANNISAPVYFYDHHLCHAVTAYTAGGKKDALIITMDGEGDEKSCTVSEGHAGSVRLIASAPANASIGWLYSEMTRFCGFKTSRHEGKITGLAAYGTPERGWGIIKNEIRLQNGLFYFPKSSPVARFLMRVRAKLGLGRYAVNHWRSIIFMIDHLTREDMAATIQYALEVRVSELVHFWATKTGLGHIVTAGGVFANVKLNQKIAELPSVESFFVYPNMGDGGNAYGAAMLALQQLTQSPIPCTTLEQVYYGPEFSNDEIEKILQSQCNISFKKVEDIATEAAQLVHEKKIVGWFQGRMEYGPRALGNRSIVAHPEDSTINKWLNDRMKRTEFMPFAPSCLFESADDLFFIAKDSMKYPAEFMTITFDMKPEWTQKAPAVAHVDGTARPQLVRKETNPRYYALIERYSKLSGLPLMINTSFNVHEEPIVCKPEEAIASLQSGMVDALAIGDFIVTKS